MLLLWLAVCWGAVLRSGWASMRMRHATKYGMHMTCAQLGLCLAGVHALAQLAVPLGKVRWVDEAVPFANPADPVGIGLGVLAIELMVALVLSVLVQRRLGYHRWRRLHLAAYPAFGLMVAHALLAGSDVHPMWVHIVVLTCCAVAVVLWLATTGLASRVPRRVASGLSGRGGQVVTVQVDPTRCVRFGFCEHEAPEVFHLRGDGMLTYRPTVPPDRVEGVLRAVGSCPARAILLGRQATAVVVPGSPRRAAAPTAVPDPPADPLLDPRTGGWRPDPYQDAPYEASQEVHPEIHAEVYQEPFQESLSEDTGRHHRPAGYSGRNGQRGTR